MASTLSPWQWTGGRPDLARHDTDIRADDLAALPALDDLIAALEEAQRRLHANGRHAVLLVLQGLDASGKDSLIRTLAQGLDPAGFKVWSFGRPTTEEAAHDFLWRAVLRLPAHGEVAAFNRSHYEAVLAERLLPGADTRDRFWNARCATITGFEKHLRASGTRIIKVWLHQSREEQRQRLLKRLDEPRKRWKFEPADIDTFKERERYLKAVEKAIAKTHHADAPWHIVPADSKADARRVVAALLLEVLEELAPAYPDEDADALAGYRAQLLAAGKD